MQLTDLPGTILPGSFLRQIGRGAAGARSLDRAQAHELFSEILANRIEPVALGGILIALRMKGESLEELLGALDALAEVLEPVPCFAERPVVSIPSYNGARKLPNLTWLLAQLLADQGVQVVVHGVDTDPARITTRQIATNLGHRPIQCRAEALDCFARMEPAFTPIALLSPALDGLLGLRRVMGVRNVAHSLVKLLNPVKRQDCLRLAAYTHPEFARLQEGVFTSLGEPAMVARATEGEVVANVHRQARMDWIHSGSVTSVLEAEASAAAALIVLPEKDDVHATCSYIQSVLAGELPVPDPIQRQVTQILRALRTSV